MDTLAKSPYFTLFKKMTVPSQYLTVLCSIPTLDCPWHQLVAGLKAESARYTFYEYNLHHCDAKNYCSRMCCQDANATNILHGFGKETTLRKIACSISSFGWKGMEPETLILLLDHVTTHRP